MSFIAAGVGLTLKLGRRYRKMRLAGILKLANKKVIAIWKGEHRAP
jgi:hypothetical protein